MSGSCKEKRVRPDSLKRARFGPRTPANDSERHLTGEGPPDVHFGSSGSEGSAQNVKPPTASQRVGKGPEYFANASRKYRERKKADIEQLKTENARLKMENERLRVELANCGDSPPDSNDAMLKEIHSLLKKQNDWIKGMTDSESRLLHSKNEQELLTAVVYNSEELVDGDPASPTRNSFFYTVDIDRNIAPEFLELVGEAM
jgi:hypothetical protein